MLKQKLDKFLSIAKTNSLPACFSLLCGWLVTLSIFLIKETIAKPAEEAQDESKKKAGFFGRLFGRK